MGGLVGGICFWSQIEIIEFFRLSFVKKHDFFLNSLLNDFCFISFKDFVGES